MYILRQPVLGGGTNTVAGAIHGMKRTYVPLYKIAVQRPNTPHNPYNHLLNVLEGVGNFFQEVSDKKQPRKEIFLCGALYFLLILFHRSSSCSAPHRCL